MYDVIPVPVGSRYIDTDTKITPDLARKLRAAGVDGFIRYVSLGPERASDLDGDELEGLLDTGAGVMCAQHVRYPGWIPSGAQGEADGAQAAANAKSIGLMPGTHLWADLEGEGDTNSHDVLDWGVGWYKNAVLVFPPGLYVGYQCGLNGPQLYSLPFEAYWESQSAVPAPLPRGYRIQQAYPSTTLCGISIDYNQARMDWRRGQCMAMVKR